MLLKLREKTTGWIAGVIVGILIIPFAFFGVNNYFSAQAETWVARVGEVEIDQQQFQARFEEYRQQMRRMLGDRYDGREIERPETRLQFLEQLVDEELLRQAGLSHGVAVPAAVLQKEIAGVSAFQVGGRFNVDQYRLLLSAQNMTPRDFEQRVRRDLEVKAIPGAIEASAFATVQDVDRYLALRDQRRDLRYLLLEAPGFDAAAIGDEELEAYYRTNLARYQTEEQVAIEYIELDGSTLEVPTRADQDSLRRRYEEQRSRFVEPEQRLASHILIKVASGADADVQRAAQARAQALVEQARAGADFAALAREHSEDVGSRADGGDLGWLETGLTEPAFDTALFALAEGAISDPVKTGEGWHVIQLRELRPEKGRSFEEVREELEREFLESERERRFSDLAGQMVDALYRDPNTLDTAARQLGLEPQVLGPFGRAGGMDPISSHPEVLAAAFSEGVLREGNVSDAITLEEGRLLALRVAEHLPPTPIPLEVIRDQVEAELRAERRSAAARERAAALYARWQEGESLEALAGELELQVQSANDIGRDAALLDRAIVSRAFDLPPPLEGAASPRAHVELGGDRHALIELLAVRPGDASKVDLATRNALREQLGQVIAVAETRAYLDALKAQFPVRLAPERL